MRFSLLGFVKQGREETQRGRRFSEVSGEPVQRSWCSVSGLPTSAPIHTGTHDAGVQHQPSYISTVGDLHWGHCKDREEVKQEKKLFYFPTVNISTWETHLFIGLYKVVEKQKQRVHRCGKVKTTSYRLKREFNVLERQLSHFILILMWKPPTEKYMWNSKFRSSPYSGPRISQGQNVVPEVLLQRASNPGAERGAKTLNWIFNFPFLLQKSFLTEALLSPPPIPPPTPQNSRVGGREDSMWTRQVLGNHCKSIYRAAVKCNFLCFWGWSHGKVILFPLYMAPSMCSGLTVNDSKLRGCYPPQILTIPQRKNAGG